MNSKPKILYVDDEEINLKLLEINLQKYFNVLIYESATAALNELANNQDVQIVISDMKMPIMNGLEFINKARKKYPDIKYMIFTGYEITDEIQKALNNGIIVNYIRKPFNLRQLKSMLEEMIINNP